MKSLSALLASILLACTASAATLRVSAAASLSDVLHDVAAVYEKESGDTVVFNFGASSTLARQIVEGAPADVFLSADEAKMDELQSRAMIVTASRKSILSNTLVIIVPSSSRRRITAPRDLASAAIRSIAIAEPQSVPAGIYAKEWLVRQRVWDAIANKIIPTDNVRAALAAVASENADAGIVYQTDARMSKSVRIAFEVPRAQGPKISYAAAALSDSKQPAAAQRFLDFLQSPRARKIFERYGFLIP